MVYSLIHLADQRPNNAGAVAEKRDNRIKRNKKAKSVSMPSVGSPRHFLPQIFII